MGTYAGDAERFTEWLRGQVLADATGAAFQELEVAPTGKFWLGYLSPEVVAQQSSLGDRVDRITPCEMGFRFRHPGADVRVQLSATGTTWLRTAETDDTREDGPARRVTWRKEPEFDIRVGFDLPGHDSRLEDGDVEGSLALGPDHAIAIEVEHRDGPGGPEVIVTLVNTSPAPAPGQDNNLYEVQLEVSLGTAPPPYLLETLPSSFRYDRRVPVYGINCGVVRLADGRFVTADAVEVSSRRPEYWDADGAGPPPDLRFATLGDDPRPSARSIVTAMRRWRDANWSTQVLDARAEHEGWNDELRRSADNGAATFDAEISRVQAGVELLEDDAQIRHAYQLTNRAMVIAAAGKYEGWRPFQVGFQLATLPSLREEVDRDVVDTLWFATGGGKTETYLGLVLASAFLDRLRGKSSGVTAWARFPLRMLSLQQTQRFAEMLAAAELVRCEEGLDGDEFALGFLVGGSSTPNEFRADPSPEQPDFRARGSHEEYRVLIRCPFCHDERLEVIFDEARWALDHHCTNKECTWDGPLPFRVVDHEIFRYLPTVIVGTIDKTAGLGFQAALAGLYGPPHGRCSTDGHGFTYALRSKRPSGCLVPGCEAPKLDDLGQARELFGPTLRIQDELHLLRDSLGAMSAHYESVLDHLQERYGPRAKILASSATLAGYESQVETLYQRRGRVFPTPGPYHDRSFWSTPQEALGRRFVGVAPRGVTLDFAADRLVEALQRTVRRVDSAPAELAGQIGVDVASVPELISDYGTDVSYGSTLRDVEAAARSFETQIPIEGQLNAVTLTGRVPFDTVREALQRLEDPEPDFQDRIHLIAASSMISHGVDVDRLNAMVVMGLPLTTAEFIQSTARVGRSRPGLVFVLHKMLRERDAAVFRSFELFVTHADRLVEPVPITRRSRAVLARTFPGLLMARLLGIHERANLEAGGGALTTVTRWRNAMTEGVVDRDREAEELIELLGADQPLDELLRHDLERFVDAVNDAVLDFATEERFPSDLLSRVLEGREPMTSLRDVDVPVPIYSRGRGGRRA